MDTIMMEQMMARYWDCMEDRVLPGDRNSVFMEKPSDRRWRTWTWRRR